jgi:glucarate dehydratase
MRPTIKSVEAHLIALRDCPLLNLSGLHATHFLRTIFILNFDNGMTGIAEVPGDQRIVNILTNENMNALVKGMNLTLENYCHIREALKSHYAELDEGGRGDQTFDTRVLVHVLAALETAWLDALGKYEKVGMSAILGERFGVKPRDFAEVNGYIFFVADTSRTDLDFAPETKLTGWEKVRHTPAIDAEGVVRHAKAAYQRYGFRYWKLKGGVFPPDVEAAIVEKAYAAVGGEWTLDPNGAWTVEESIRVVKRLKSAGAIKYIEDPSKGLENMAAVYAATGVPQASNMVGTDWPSLFEAVGKKAVQLPLVDPHFWAGPWAGLEVVRAINNGGCKAGVHSNNHGLTSLATVAHMMATAPLGQLASDTHYIFTRDDDPVISKLEIKGGQILLPKDTMGLGVEIDRKKLLSAINAAKQLGTSARNDAVQMRMLPGYQDWKFDSSRPSMVR